MWQHLDLVFHLESPAWHKGTREQPDKKKARHLVPKQEMRTLKLRCLWERAKVAQLSNVDKDQTWLDVTLKLRCALSDMHPPCDVTRIRDSNYCVNRKDCGREMTLRAWGSSWEWRKLHSGSWLSPVHDDRAHGVVWALLCYVKG